MPIRVQNVPALHLKSGSVKSTEQSLAVSKWDSCDSVAIAPLTQYSHIWRAFGGLAVMRILYASHFPQLPIHKLGFSCQTLCINLSLSLRHDNAFPS